MCVCMSGCKIAHQILTCVVIMTGSYATLMTDDESKDTPAKHRTPPPVAAADCLLTQLFLLVMRLVHAAKLVREARLPSHVSPAVDTAMRAAARTAADRMGGVLEDDPKTLLKNLEDQAGRLECDIGMLLMLPDLQNSLCEC